MNDGSRRTLGSIRFGGLVSIILAFKLLSFNSTSYSFVAMASALIYCTFGDLYDLN